VCLVKQVKNVEMEAGVVRAAEKSSANEEEEDDGLPHTSEACLEQMILVNRYVAEVSSSFRARCKLGAFEF